MRVDYRLRHTHIWAYEAWIGPVPHGLELDHLCRIPSCCRPDHLEPVTHQVNVLRGTGVAAANAIKTACPAGHEYTADNTYLRKKPNGRTARRCRTCVLIQNAASASR